MLWEHEVVGSIPTTPTTSLVPRDLAVGGLSSQ